jgi:hypothetical protein
MAQVRKSSFLKEKGINCIYTIKRPLLPGAENVKVAGIEPTTNGIRRLGLNFFCVGYYIVFSFVVMIDVVP